MQSQSTNSTRTVILFSLALLISIFAGFQKASAQLYFADVTGSQLKISGSKNGQQLIPVTSTFSCDGKFTMVDGELQNLDSLTFDLPLYSKTVDHRLIDPTMLAMGSQGRDFSFELTHSMVLPELNMIHAIGFLNIQGVKTRVDFHLDYIENDMETITILGKKSIKLSDYKKDPISIFAKAKAQDIIQLDLKLVIKNPTKVEYVAALVP